MHISANYEGANTFETWAEIQESNGRMSLFRTELKGHKADEALVSQKKCTAIRRVVTDNMTRLNSVEETYNKGKRATTRSEGQI